MANSINLNKSFIFDTLPEDKEWQFVDPDMPEDADKGWVVVGEEAQGYLNRSHNPYETNSEIQISGSTGNSIPTPKCWHTDFSRRGKPDQFLINSRVVDLEADPEEVVRKVYDVVGRDPSETRKALAVWSYRSKGVLIDETSNAFISKYGLGPVFSREGGYREVQLDLDEDRVYCTVSGKIGNAVSLDTLDLQPVDISFTATSEIRLDGSGFFERIEFTDGASPKPKPPEPWFAQLKQNFWSYLGYQKV